MEFLEMIHFLLLTISIAAVIWHMNDMWHKRTPKLEVVAWWTLGVGLFGEWFWQLYWWYRSVPYYVSPEHLFENIGIGILAVIYTQPQWRPLLAERRIEDDASCYVTSCDRRQARKLEWEGGSDTDTEADGIVRRPDNR